jgi:hypothetical protein
VIYIPGHRLAPQNGLLGPLIFQAMRKKLTILFILLSINNLFGQKGYVKLENGSILSGYLRFQINRNNGEREIELWKTKKDKSPEVYSYYDLIEYGYKKDTFRILKNFYPYEDKDKPYFSCIEAKVICRGKIDLLLLNNDSEFKVTSITGGGLIPAIVDQSLGNTGIMYVLFDNSSNYASAVRNKDEFYASVKDFIEDDYSLLRSIYQKELKYKDIRKIVEMYNSNKMPNN